MIACLGETSGIDALTKNLAIIKMSPEGLKILDKKPRINSSEINLTALDNLPKKSFGYQYKQFLVVNVIVFFFYCFLY